MKSSLIFPFLMEYSAYNNRTVQMLNQIFFRGTNMYSKARVMDFVKGETQQGYAVRGREGRQYRRLPNGYINGNGMFLSYPKPYFCAKLYVYKPYPHVEMVDIRTEALEASGRSRITENYVQEVRDANCGKKIGVYVNYGEDAEIADIDELDLSL